MGLFAFVIGLKLSWFDYTYKKGRVLSMKFKRIIIAAIITACLACAAGCSCSADVSGVENTSTTNNSGTRSDERY